jgi:hypothetical protein
LFYQRVVSAFDGTTRSEVSLVHNVRSRTTAAIVAFEATNAAIFGVLRTGKRRA